MSGSYAVDPASLGAMLEASARIGGTNKGGLRRLALTREDKAARDQLADWARQGGWGLKVDGLGNMFVRREGSEPALAPVLVGSHLDTQAKGGRFDGILGVLSGIEILRTLDRLGIATKRAIEVVNWTNEEGSRFQPGCVASGVFGGVYDRDWACARADRAGVVFGDALAAIGYVGRQRCGDHPLSAFFELHIEQGPLLEAEGKAIGIVTGIQGVHWFEVTITGQDAHTGATPMHLRKNALLGAARLIERVEAIARANAPLAVATVGSMEVKPNSPNVVPGEVYLTVDLRHPDRAVLEKMDAALASALPEVCEPLGLSATSNRIWDQAPIVFDAQCVDCVRTAAATSGLAARDIVSGASHDAAYVSRVTPTAMVFVPCRDGISHNEIEFSSKQQCAAGAQVLLQAVLDYDRRLAERYADGKSS